MCKYGAKILKLCISLFVAPKFCMGIRGPEVSQSFEVDLEQITNTKHAVHHLRCAYGNTRKK